MGSMKSSDFHDVLVRAGHGVGSGLNAGETMVKPVHVLTGAVMAGAGALAGLWITPGLVGVAVVFVLLRVCWLEDNIVSDLFGRDTLPRGYRNTAVQRRNFLLAWFGIWARETTAEGSAHLMATAMRTEVQIWATLLWGGASALVALHAPFGTWISLCIATALFVVALTRADKLAGSLAHCEAGKALPAHMLLPLGRRMLADRGR